MSKIAIVVFIVLPAYVIFAAPLHLGEGSHEDSMRLREDDQKAYGLRAQAIVIDVGQCIFFIESINPTPSPDF
jgi:hypothetical protein